MAEGGEKKASCGVDRLSSLPDSVLLKILLDLGTKDMIRASSLTPKWENLWKSIPALEVNYYDFPDNDTFVSFVNSCLGTDIEVPLQRFNAMYNYEREVAVVRGWINTAIMRNVKHLLQIDASDAVVGTHDAHIPESIYNCESLVSLGLREVTVASPGNIVSLPCLKEISFNSVKFVRDSDFKMLILGCPVLQRLSICKRSRRDIGVVGVYSQSLLSFSFVVDPVDVDAYWGEDSVVTIDAPKLEYLQMRDHRTASFELENCTALVKADLDITFNLYPGGDPEDNLDPDDLPKRNMISKFLLGISGVKDMVVSSDTLEVIYDYSRYESVPLFHNLSFLRAQFIQSRWGMLPIFLESCPNLKSIVVGSADTVKEGIFGNFPEARSELVSLEYARIERLVKRESLEMKLVRYFLEKLPNLKELTLSLDEYERKTESVILQEILSIPRLSTGTSCKVIINYVHVKLDLTLRLSLPG